MRLTKNFHVLILGCGSTGKSIAEYLVNNNIKISLYDEKKDNLDKAIKHYNIKPPCFSGCLEERYFDKIDIVAVSPGMDLRNPVLKKIQEKGIKFCNDISLFFDNINLTQTKIIGVTGTNGKTTTCCLLEKILLKSNIKCCVAGNIGLPVLDIKNPSNYEVIILELSSFQLELIECDKIDVGIILNISKDHMDRYSSFDDYLAMKSKLINQSKVKIINRDNEFLIDLHTDISFGVSKFNGSSDYWLKKESSFSYIISEAFELNISSFKLIGRHNQLNLMAAISCIRVLYPDFNFMESVIGTLNSQAHRLEWVIQINGVDFYNDSKSTNVNSTVAAIESFHDKKILLIAGGEAKNQPLKPLKKFLIDKVKYLFLIGKDKILFENNFSDISTMKIIDCDSMKKAVTLANKKADSGDIILLSPACASYDMYKNYIERGNNFKSLVKEL